jgi:hypothetical protein
MTGEEDKRAKEDEKGRPGSKQGGPFVCAGEGKDEDTDLQDPAEHKALNGD